MYELCIKCSSDYISHNGMFRLFFVYKGFSSTPSMNTPSFTHHSSPFMRLLPLFFATFLSLVNSVTLSAGVNGGKEGTPEYNARAQWLRDEKVGVFIHWNPSATIGKEISWCRTNPIYGNIGAEKYDALYKDFKGEAFNADEWITLFRESGIKYAVFVPKHHDGFAMFATKTYDYNVMKSPFGRDFIKEVSEACRKGDVRFCLYYSVLDWWNPLYSPKQGADLSAYIDKVFKPQMKELLSNYGPVGSIWFDGHWDASWTHAYAKDMEKFIRKIQPKTLLGNRLDQKFAGNEGPNCSWTGSFFNAKDAIDDYQAREVDLGKYFTDRAWDSCYSLCGVNHKWSWVPPMNPVPLADIVNWLVQCIGRDGGMLLGVGPRGDGSIDPASAARMLELGAWLKVYGEAVYKTRGGPWLPSSWCVSTRRGNKAYVFVTKWKGTDIQLPALSMGVTSARLVGGGPATVTKTPGSITIHVDAALRKPITTIIELTLERDCMSQPVLEVPEPTNLAKGILPSVSSFWPGRDKELSPKYITDGTTGSLWATEEAAREGWVSVDLGKDQTISDVMLSDAPYKRTQQFTVEAKVGDVWKPLVSGTTIGDELHLSFEPIKARIFRVNIQKASDTPTLAEFQLFGVPSQTTPAGR